MSLRLSSVHTQRTLSSTIPPGKAQSPLSLRLMSKISSSSVVGFLRNKMTGQVKEESRKI